MGESERGTTCVLRGSSRHKRPALTEKEKGTAVYG